jgi:hypothetical protein
MGIKTVTLSQVFNRMQFRQELHDVVFHSDIYTLSKPRRLTHLVLHHCKYVSELYRMFIQEDFAALQKDGPQRERIRRLTVDGLIICLSMANVCNKRLGDVIDQRVMDKEDACGLLLRRMGMMAKTIEDIDHMGQTNPLGEIMESAALMAGCYVNLYVLSYPEYHCSLRDMMYDMVEKRLLEGERRNIYFGKHIVEMNRRMQNYDQQELMRDLSKKDGYCV